MLCLNPDEASLSESVRALTFASRVKQVAGESKAAGTTGSS